jgi:hypothetical protein
VKLAEKLCRNLATVQKIQSDKVHILVCKSFMTLHKLICIKSLPAWVGVDASHRDGDQVVLLQPKFRAGDRVVSGAFPHQHAHS